MNPDQNAGQPKRKGPGKKSKLTPELVNRARELAKEGALDKEIAANLGIALSTICDYKNKYPEFSDAIKKGREYANQCVVGALFRAATGYESRNIQRKYVYKKRKNGKIEKVLESEYEEIKHVAGSVGDRALWLNNKMAEEFARRPEDVATKIAAINFNMVVLNQDGSQSVVQWPPSIPPKPTAK